ncbi:MAG: hypothetical protein E6F99_09720 [Actinobacteria bacterium]|nr:MAG: hypothetical protein E6F99_09720 [Actinomycetota bacterium]
MRTPSKRMRLALLLAAIPIGLLGSGLFVWQASYSAFSDTTTNGANSWSAGTVTISSAPGTAMFTASGLKPGDNGTACIKVTYTGSLNSVVKLYLKNADLTGTGLATYLTFQVNEGTGNNANCSDFAQSANDYNAVGMGDTTKTLSGFNTTAHDYSTGLSSWSATTGGTKTYEFIWQLQDNNSAAGLTAGATFTWEADNS